MEDFQAVRALAALAHESRLGIFRLLVKCGDSGLPAGKIAAELDLPGATLSFHLKELSIAGLVWDRREGRSVIYGIEFENTKDLLSFLLKDCCGGHPELCTPGCRPATKSKRVRRRSTE
jgi:ArsR family transcriptional regulator, arsenate/arsenite/antimonite-responsive transcriptional repressor